MKVLTELQGTPLHQTLYLYLESLKGNPEPSVSLPFQARVFLKTRRSNLK